jgi:hypothetical protein
LFSISLLTPPPQLWCRREERRTHLVKVERAREARLAFAAQTTAACAAAGAPPPAPSYAPAHTKRVPVPTQAAAPPPPPAVGAKRKAPAVGKPAVPHFTPALMLPRAGAARSTAGGIAAWALDVRSGPVGGQPLGASQGFALGGRDDEKGPMAAIASHISLALRPLAAQSTKGFAGGPESTAPAWASGSFFMASPSPSPSALLANLQRTTEWLSGIAHDMAAALASLKRRSSQLTPEHAAQVAWLRLLGQNCPLEDCLLRLQAGLHAATATVTQGAQGAFGAHPAGCEWPDDMVQGALLGLELVARCQSLAMQSKFVRYETYVRITIQLKQLVSDYCSSVGATRRARSERLAGRVAAQQRAALEMLQPTPLEDIGEGLEPFSLPPLNGSSFDLLALLEPSNVSPGASAGAGGWAEAATAMDGFNLAMW